MQHGNIQQLVPKEIPLEKEGKCFCSKPKKITVDHEIVCVTCGIVLGFDNEQLVTTNSHLNLYLRTEKGGKPSDRPVEMRKLHIHSSDSSEISDICTKLSLPDTSTTEIWHLYSALKEQTNFSKAKSACFAIYYACRKNQIPFKECEVQEIVKMSFHVKNAPKLLDIICKVNKINLNSGDNNTIATHLGVDTTADNPMNFYLKMHLKHSQESHPDLPFDRLQNIARQYFEKFTRFSNNDTRAKQAVLLAEIRCGI